MTVSKDKSAANGNANETKAISKRTRWTVMCYLAGDNNLSTDMAYTVEQIKTAADQAKNVDLFVYFDGFSRNVPTLYCDFSDHDHPVKYHRAVGIQEKLIDNRRRAENPQNENSASMYNLLNFVDWCVRKDKPVKNDDGTTTVDLRAEKKYALIISGHSFGFSNWALFKDENADYYMTLSKLRWLLKRIALSESELAKKEAKRRNAKTKPAAKDPDRAAKILTQRTTEILGKPIDVLGFDSCEMSKLEIGIQFDKLAKTLVASEGSVPNAGWSYAQILLGRLEGVDSDDEKKVAAGFVENFIKQQNKFAIADISVDMTAWDLTRIRPLGAAVGKLAGSLLACLKDEGSITFHQTRRLLTYVHWRTQTYSFEQNVDLGDLCEQLIAEIDLLSREIDKGSIALLEAVRRACEKVIDELRQCVLLCGFSGSDFQYSKGISIFFPWSWEAYLSTEVDYGKLRFIKKKSTGAKWDEFLRRYLGVVTWRQGNPVTPVDQFGDLNIDPKNPAVVYRSYAFVDPIDTSLLGDWDDGEKRPPNDAKRPPNDAKRPPNDAKRPPNDAKRPPNDAKGVGSNMSAFFARFMKMKNIGGSWNRAGFASSRVKFKPESDVRSKTPSVADRDDVLLTLEVPVATGIQKMLDLSKPIIEKIAANDEEVEKFQRLFAEALRNQDTGVAKLVSEPSFAKLFENQPGEAVNIEDLITKAISSLKIGGETQTDPKKK